MERGPPTISPEAIVLEELLKSRDLSFQPLRGRAADSLNSVAGFRRHDDKPNVTQFRARSPKPGGGLSFVGEAYRGSEGI